MDSKVTRKLASFLSATPATERGRHRRVATKARPSGESLEGRQLLSGMTSTGPNSMYMVPFARHGHGHGHVARLHRGHGHVARLGPAARLALLESAWADATRAGAATNPTGTIRVQGVTQNYTSGAPAGTYTSTNGLQLGPSRFPGQVPTIPANSGVSANLNQATATAPLVPPATLTTPPPASTITVTATPIPATTTMTTPTTAPMVPPTTATTAGGGGAIAGPTGMAMLGPPAMSAVPIGNWQGGYSAGPNGGPQGGYAYAGPVQTGGPWRGSPSSPTYPSFTATPIPLMPGQGASGSPMAPGAPGMGYMGPTADQLKAYDQLATDQQAIQDKSDVTPRMEAALRNDVQAIHKDMTTAPDATAVKTLQTDLKAVATAGTLPTDAQLTQIQADVTAVFKSAGVTDATLIAKTIADANTIRVATNVTNADLATLAADRKAVGLDPNSDPGMGMGLGLDMMGMGMGMMPVMAQPLIMPAYVAPPVAMTVAAAPGAPVMATAIASTPGAPVQPTTPNGPLG